MKKLFFFLFLIAFLFSSCDLLNPGDEPPDSEELYGLSDGDIFIYTGHWSKNPSHSLVYTYSNGNFVPSKLNKTEATDIEIVDENTIKIYIDGILAKDYIIAEKSVIKSSDYEAWHKSSDYKGVYNGLWRSSVTYDAIGKDGVFMAINCKTKKIIIECLETKQVYRETFEIKYRANNFPYISIDMETPMGQRVWEIIINPLVLDLDNPIVCKFQSKDEDTIYSNEWGLKMIDDKR